MTQTAKQSYAESFVKVAAFAATESKKVSNRKSVYDRVMSKTRNEALSVNLYSYDSRESYYKYQNLIDTVLNDVYAKRMNSNAVREFKRGNFLLPQAYY